MSERDERFADEPDDAVYRIIDAALRHDPGYALPPGFADRATLAALKPRRRFDWFEQLLVPALITPVIVYMRTFLGDTINSLLPRYSDAIMTVVHTLPKFPIDDVLFAAFALLLSAGFDRWLRWRHRQHVAS